MDFEINDIVKDLPPSGIRKFFDLVLAAGPEVVSLGVGEPDFSTPWNIREAAIFALEHEFTSYTENAGLFELREKISEKIFSETGKKYHPKSEILVTNGVSEGMDLAFRTILNRGEKVLVPNPGYVMYDPLIKLAGGKTLFYDPLNIKNSLKKFREEKNIKAILLNFPGNPLGNTFTSEEFEFIADFAEEKNLIILSDEIYGLLSFESQHESILTIKKAQKRTILFDGLSKSHAMTGLRIGWVAGPKILVSAMTKIHQYSALCASSISQLASIEALKSNDEALNMKNIYNTRRKFCIQRLSEMPLKFIPPKGAFYIFVDISKSGLDDITFCEQLLKKEKLAVVPGSAFGSAGENHIRMTYAASSEDLEKAMNRLAKFMKRF